MRNRSKVHCFLKIGCSGFQKKIFLKPRGTLIGVLIIAVLNNGLNLLAVPSFYQDIASGVVIALALLLYRAIR